MNLCNFLQQGMRRACRGGLAVIIALAILALVVGCGSGAAETVKTLDKEDAVKGNAPAPAMQSAGYEVTRETYTDRAITIHYPQISKLNDAEKQNRLNQIIVSEVLSILQEYNKDALEKLTVKLDFVIGRQDAELLSARFTGSRYMKDTPYPTALFQSVNLDMKAGSKLRLRDIVQVDDKFVDFVLKSRRISAPGVTNERLNLDKNKLIKVFNQADSSVASENPERAFSYFTQDGIGISFNVRHALGDHIEYEFGKEGITFQPGKAYLLK